MSEKVLYSKYSNERADEYCISTDIISASEKKIVRKKATTLEAQAHIQNMQHMYQQLENLFAGSRFCFNKIVKATKSSVDFEYIDGESFDVILDQIYEEKGYEALIDKIKEFFEELDKCAEYTFENSELFKKYFGEYDGLQTAKCLKPGNIDLIFQNVLVDSAGNWNVIDYEWTIGCTIPVEFVKYRAIKLYVYVLSKRQSLVEKNLFSVFGIDFQYKKLYEAMDEHFQHVIKGNKYRLDEFFTAFGKVAFDAKNEFHEKENHIIEVYLDKGDGFTEKDKYQYASFPIHINVDKNVKKIRICPMRKMGYALIRRLEDQTGRCLRYITNGEEESAGWILFATENPWIDIMDSLDTVEYITVIIEVNAINESCLNEIKKERVGYHKELIDCHDQMRQIADELHNANLVINQMQNTVSWKITKPIRIGKNGCKTVMQKSRICRGAWKVLHSLRRNGYKTTLKKIYRKIMHGTSGQNGYIYTTLSEKNREEQKNHKFLYNPEISILVPLYNTPDNFLREMIDSVRNQTYVKWQLCLADGSDESHKDVERRCKEYIKKDSRISYKKLKKNGGISENTNACLEMATGEFIGLFDHDDLLTEDCLFEVVKALNKDEKTDAIYTDEDKLLYDPVAKTGQYVEPHFKSDFNIDLFRTNNYICHFFVVRKTIVDEVGGFRSEYDGSQDFDFIFRCVEQARKIAHVPKILYHWRIHANSTAANPRSKMYCYEAGKKAIESHLERMHIKAEVEMTEHLGFYRVKYPVKGNPLVSIIIPNKDEKDTLQKCIESILKKSTYKNYEIIIVENNSTSDEIFAYYREVEKNKQIKVVYWKDSFNYSKINNYGVTFANGDYFILLNNDVEIITERWIEEMLSNCQRKEVGIVGAKLLYPDNTIQHCGVIMRLGGIAGHAFVGMDGQHPGYFGRAIIQQDLSAVTAACLMVSRKVYGEVNGLEEKLTVAFNDVDFCLKVRKAGYLVVMNPNVRLYHYESKSRGAEDTPEKQERFKKECQYMAEHWRDILVDGDPYYNPNLTLIRGDFSPAGKDEIAPSYV